MDHRPLLLALDLLHQPSDRPCCRPPLVALREGARSRPEGGHDRLDRDRAPRRRAGGPPDRARARRDRGLVLKEVHRGPDRGGGGLARLVRREGADGRSPRRRPAGPQEPEAGRRREPDVHSRLRPLRHRVHRPGVHAAAPRLHRDEDGNAFHAGRACRPVLPSPDGEAPHEGLPTRVDGDHRLRDRRHSHGRSGPAPSSPRRSGTPRCGPTRTAAGCARSTRPARW